MNCIYLNAIRSRADKYTCHAQPLRPNETIVYYLPTEDELKKFCKNSDGFPLCPRLKAMQQITFMKSE